MESPDTRSGSLLGPARIAGPRDREVRLHVREFWRFVHFVGVFGLLISHGVSMSVTFRIRSERDPKRVNELLQFSSSSLTWFYISLGVLLVGGIFGGFVGDWWGQAWIWASIMVLLITMIAMYAMARPYFRRVGVVARAMAEGSEAVSPEQFDSILRSSRPLTIAGIGFAGLFLILYMMVFKPSLGFGAAVAPPPAACSPSGTELQIAADDVLFDRDCLAAPAGQAFTIAFENREPVPHNVAVYTDSSAAEPLFVGEIFSGPDTVTYRVDALEAGTYFFRCDVHPVQMIGTFVVE